VFSLHSNMLLGITSSSLYKGCCWYPCPPSFSSWSIEKDNIVSIVYTAKEEIVGCQIMDKWWIVHHILLLASICFRRWSISTILIWSVCSTCLLWILITPLNLWLLQLIKDLSRLVCLWINLKLGLLYE
jgi:hypothetical protein